MPLWYVMDEFGVRIGHSTTPNCRVVPLLFVPQNVAYNVLFMTSKIDEDGRVLAILLPTKERVPEMIHLKTGRNENSSAEIVFC